MSPASATVTEADLPVELIDRILVKTVEGEALDQSPPWALALVDRRWREIAVRIPTLWTKLSAPHPGARSVEQLTIQTGRVFNAPVTVSFGSTRSRNLTGHPPIELLKVMANVSRLWVSADLHLLPEHMGALTQVENQIQLLESLTISLLQPLDPRKTTAALPITSNPFGNAPSLRTVQLSAWEHHTRILLPWPQLTRIFAPWSAEFCQTVLMSTPNLEVLELFCLTDLDDEFIYIPSVHLPQLRSLQIPHFNVLPLFVLRALLQLIVDDQGLDSLFRYYLFRKESPETAIETLEVKHVLDLTAMSNLLVLSPTVSNLIVHCNARTSPLSDLKVTIRDGRPCCSGRRVTSITVMLDMHGTSALERVKMENDLCAMAHTRSREYPGNDPCARLCHLTFQSKNLTAGTVQALEAVEGLETSRI
ncbi:hypothetical protein DFH09DRAFT_1291618 [Mycena vulgaris]|nr:hypothetical protein DFH09DRAFT_1291618 [Mycena vulgaris]